MVRLFIFISLFFISCTGGRKINLDEIGTSSSLRYMGNCKSRIIVDSAIDLQGKKIKIGCDLEFRRNGSFKNGTLIGNNTKIICTSNHILFNEVNLQGTWNISGGRISWFTNGHDPKLNFKAMCSLIEIGATIFLDKFYNIATESRNDSYVSIKDIKIIGTNANLSGLCLQTKHSNGEAYFKSRKGNNVFLKNITIKTNDFSNKIKPIGNDYCFARCDYSILNRESLPDFKFFIMDSCTISGAVLFKYAVSPDNTSPAKMLESGIEKIRIENSKIEESVTFLELSNGRYDTLIIANNVLKNLFGCTFFFPLGGMPDEYSSEALYRARKICQFNNNIIKNDFPVNSLGYGYMSPIVAKGFNFSVESNRIEDLINLRDGIETVPFYCAAAGMLKIHNNFITNCLGRGVNIPGGASNCLLKLKGAKNVIASNNAFLLEKEALEFLGIISLENANQILNVNKFRFCLIGSELNNNDYESFYFFDNNIFSAELLTDLSHLSRSNLEFRNNRFSINNLVASDVQNWGDGGIHHPGTIFLLRDSVKNGNMNFLNNYVEIQNLNTDCYFTKDFNDNKSFVEVNYLGNVFKLNGNISIATPRSFKTTLNNTLQGKGCLYYNEMSTANIGITLNNIDATYLFDEYVGCMSSPIHIKSNGIVKLISTKNNSNYINLLDVRLNDLYYNSKLKTTPIIININAKIIDNNGKLSEEDFRIIFGSHQSLYYKDNNKKFRESAIFDTTISDSFTILPESRNIKSILLSFEKNSDKNLSRQLKLLNTKDVKSFEISISVDGDSRLKNTPKNIESFFELR